MSHPEQQEQGERQVIQGRAENREIMAADAQAARNAGVLDVQAAQALNPNRHNGSAGGDQDQSIEIVAAGRDGSRQVIAKRQEPLTAEEITDKAQKGDLWAQKFDRDLTQLNRLPVGQEREQKKAEVMRAASFVFRPEGKPQNQREPGNGLMDTGTLLVAEAKTNPAAEPVKLLKEWVEKQPESPQKEALRQEVRNQAADLSPEMKARMEHLEEVRRKIDAAGLDEGGVHKAITPEMLAGRVEQNQPLENTADGWLEAGRRISELPAEKQLEVIGAGLMAGLEQYQADERERTWGRIIGTTEGLGAVAVNVATIAEFTCDCIAGNKERAAERGESFGKAVGETLVSGIQLFEKADQYLFKVGFDGNYARPFKDLADFGAALNDRWSQVPPREQERIKYKLITEMAADGLIGAGGAKAIGKAKVFTEVLDAVAIEAKTAGNGTVNAVKGVGKQVATDLKGMSQDVLATPTGQHVSRYIEQVMEDFTAPEMALPGGGKIKFTRDLGRPADKPITNVLMSQADDVSGGGMNWESRLKQYHSSKLGIPKDDGLEIISEIRAEKAVRNHRNIAFAQVEIDGNSKTMIGVSGQVSPKGTIETPANRLFTTKNKGGIPTETHSEVKILERLAAELNTKAKGTITLFSERKPCYSCKDVIDQFLQRFPEITLKITYGHSK